MSELKEKKFQYISWEIADDGKTVHLCSKIYDTVDEIVDDSKDVVVIAIGLNPSNTTDFNDDITNLYLRDKLHKEMKSTGYLLTNLSPKIESDSVKITLDDFSKEHIDNIIELIKKYPKSKILVFFGQTGVDFLNTKIKNKSFLGELKRFLIENKERVFYTRSTPKFTHPGRSGQDYDFAPLQEDTLDKN